jgi:hypothetical protein
MQAMAWKGLSVADIAECENCSERYVRTLMSGAADIETDHPARLAESIVLMRTFLSVHTDGRLSRQTAARKLMWIEAVMAIHRLGDAGGLRIGQEGDPYQSHTEVAEALGGVLSDLEWFLDRGLLTRLEGNAIGLPGKLGLNLEVRDPSASGEAPSRRQEIARVAANAKWEKLRSQRVGAPPHPDSPVGTAAANASLQPPALNGGVIPDVHDEPQPGEARRQVPRNTGQAAPDAGDGAGGPVGPRDRQDRKMR